MRDGLQNGDGAIFLVKIFLDLLEAAALPEGEGGRVAQLNAETNRRRVESCQMVAKLADGIAPHPFSRHFAVDHQQTNPGMLIEGVVGQQMGDTDNLLLPANDQIAAAGGQHGFGILPDSAEGKRRRAAQRQIEGGLRVDDPLLQGQPAGAQGLFGGKGNKLDLHGKWGRISVKSGVRIAWGAVGKALSGKAARPKLPLRLASPYREAQTVWPCFYVIRFKATIMTPAINLLKKLKIPHKLYPYECEAHDDFGKHAATQLGLPEAQVFKTLIAHHDKQAVVAIVPSSGMCSLKQLAKATGLKKVEMMKPAEAEKLTGYKVGGISPLAQKKLLPTVLDESAMQFDEILVSGGKRGLSVGVAPQDMLTLMKWIAAPIGEE